MLNLPFFTQLSGQFHCFYSTFRSIPLVLFLFLNEEKPDKCTVTHSRPDSEENAIGPMLLRRLVQSLWLEGDRFHTPSIPGLLHPSLELKLCVTIIYIQNPWLGWVGLG